MGTLIENLSQIDSIKSGIKSAIESKGVDMTNVSFPDYPAAIASISTAFVTETLSVTENGTYYPSVGVDGFSEVSVNVPAPVPVTESLNVSVNNTYYPGAGVDGFSVVVVDVPQSVTGYTEKELTEQAFTIINLNNSASYVANQAFKDKTDLQTVYLPNCTKVGSSAFQNCTNLSSIYLPNCTEVGSYAFESTKITSLYLSNCTSIGDFTFRSCKSLQIVNLPIISSIRSNVFVDCTSLINISLPECKIIGSYAFQKCSSLTSVDLPKCENIYEGAFNSCYQISSVSLPNCTDVVSKAFQDCSSLTSVDLPNCERLLDAFNRCSSLYSVSLPNCFQFGCTFAGTSVSYVELPMLGSLNNYFTFNSVVKAISICRDYAGCPVFAYNPYWGGLSSIYVPSELYDYFANSTKFSSFSSVLVSVPQSGSEPLISYSDGMIYGSARGINSTILSVVGVSKGDVTVLSLPNCERIDNYYGQIFTSGPLTEINLPECSIINMSFSSCTSLQRIYLPKVKAIGNEMFSSCTGLSEIDFPSAKTIGAFAFRGCTSLKVVKLSVCSYIASTAFYTAGMMQSVYLYSNSVVDINSYQYTIQAEKIYVPASLVDAYKSANYWSRWSNNIYPIE